MIQGKHIEADPPAKRIPYTPILDRAREYRILSALVDSARPGPRGMKAHPRRLKS